MSWYKNQELLRIFRWPYQISSDWKCFQQNLLILLKLYRSLSAMTKSTTSWRWCPYNFTQSQVISWDSIAKADFLQRIVTTHFINFGRFSNFHYLNSTLCQGKMNWSKCPLICRLFDHLSFQSSNCNHMLVFWLLQLQGHVDFLKIHFDTAHYRLQSLQYNHVIDTTKFSLTFQFFAASCRLIFSIWYWSSLT